MGDKTSDEMDRSSGTGAGAGADHVTIVAETYARAPTATVSSLKSEDSTEQLICKSPPKNIKTPKAKEKSVRSKSVEASVGSDVGKKRRKVVMWLGLAQAVVGTLLVGAGAGAVVKGAALARVGAGLWAGGVAVVAGLVGVLAGINDCYGLPGTSGSSPLLTGFLALSLLSLACGNSAAVLAATGLHRDSMRAPAHQDTFEDEMEAWTPVLTNIALLIIATFHCLICLVSIYHLSKRLCPCFRPKQPYDHNQFDPSYKTQGVTPYVIHLNEGKEMNVEKMRSRELCKDLEVKLQSEAEKLKKKEDQSFGSATSRSQLVSSWLGQAPRAGGGAGGGGAARGAVAGARGVRVRKGGRAPVVLVPAMHPASTLGRMPVSVMVPPRYATLPLAPYGPPPPHAPPHGPLYYPVHDTRVRRRRSPQERRRPRRRERDSQLTRSLERIHRKRRAERRAERERLSDAELKRTYTGLDRAYAEQFIAVCDESRSHAADRSDSLTSSSSDVTSAPPPHPRHRDHF